MKIGIVVPVFSEKISSPELWLAEGLARRGHTVTVITGNRPGSREAFVKDESGSVLDAQPLFRILRLATLPAWYGEAAIPLALDQVLSTGFDVLLLQEDYPPICFIAGIIAHRRGIPFVLTCERYEYFGRVPFVLLTRLQDLTSNKILWMRARALTFHSRASARFLASRGAQSDVMYYTPTPTNCALFSPRPFRRSTTGDSPLRILCVARLVQAKGLDVLLDAVRLLKSGGLDGFSVLIHGRGPLAGVLQQQIRDLRITSNVKIDQSMIPLGSLANLYRDADIYVQPSLHEPGGCAFRDAMASGLPVVATRTGGHLDITVDGVTGFLVDPGDSRGLAFALGALVESERLRTDFGRMARQKAERELDLHVVAAQYERIILHRAIEPP
jgi:glycosyltransferase involved in cell wall biosynthesis